MHRHLANEARTRGSHLQDALHHMSTAAKQRAKTMKDIHDAKAEQLGILEKMKCFYVSPTI